MQYLKPEYFAKKMYLQYQDFFVGLVMSLYRLASHEPVMANFIMSL